MCYEGALVMPSSYAVMNEEEMTYVEGGGDVALSMKKSYLNKSTCINVASNYTKTTGLSKMRIAKEIYAHAVMYYSSPAALGGLAVVLAAVTGGVAAGAVLSCLYWIRAHANPINIGLDKARLAGQHLALAAVYAHTLGTVRYDVYAGQAAPILFIRALALVGSCRSAP